MSGLIDHFDKTGKFEMVVEEPWKSYMLYYWNNNIGTAYHFLIDEQMRFLKDYKDRMI